MTRTGVIRAADALIPTVHGAEFEAVAYELPAQHLVHLALVRGDVSGEAAPLVRVHSSCLTGDVFGSLRCDCGPQFRRAMEMIDAEGRGVLVYLNQEGRGIGIVNKLRAYRLQEQGFDTVAANEHLGFDSDLRTYSAAAEILADLGVRRVRLLTNNPDKIAGLAAHGIEVVERVPIEIEPNAANARYLQTKRDRLGHFLGGLPQGS